MCALTTVFNFHKELNLIDILTFSCFHKLFFPMCKNMMWSLVSFKIYTCDTPQCYIEIYCMIFLNKFSLKNNLTQSSNFCSRQHTGIHLAYIVDTINVTHALHRKKYIIDHLSIFKVWFCLLRTDEFASGFFKSGCVFIWDHATQMNETAPPNLSKGNSGYGFVIGPKHKWHRPSLACHHLACRQETGP